MGHPVSLSDVVAYVDLLLGISPQDDREGNGIAYAAGDTVAKLGAAVNTSFEAIERAAELGVDLLLVHHTSWQEIDFELRERKLALLAERGVSLYAAHESLDRAPSIGPADALARLLGLTVESRALGGHAVVGAFADRSLSALAARTEKALRTRVRAFRNSESFERGAIAPGGAGHTSYLRETRELGCDTYVTGEGSMFTELYAREVGMNLVLAGHYQTELPGIQALAQRLAERFNLEWVTVPEPWDS